MMRSDIMQELDQRLAHLLKPLSHQLQPTQIMPQYPQPVVWPGNNYVMVLPRGEAISGQDTATSNNTSTSQPMMLVPVPLSR